jgi:kinesin family member 2/24
MADKQALFRVIQELNAEDLRLSLSPEPALTPPVSRRDVDPARIDALFTSQQESSFFDLGGGDDDFLLTDDVDAPDDEDFSESFLGAGLTPPRNPATHDGADPFADAPDPPRIRVIVRKRPLNSKEVERGDADVLECDAPGATLYVNEPKVKVDLTKYVERHSFSFDDVFDEDITNDALYLAAVQPLIATVFRAGRATCFAYGQTGSGKTYTMGPLPQRAAQDVFRVLALPEYCSLTLGVSCFEIYGGKIFDLLNGRQRLEVREDAKRRVQIVGLHETPVVTVATLASICEKAANARSTGSTGANDESSRSHSILTFSLRAPPPPPSTGVAGPGRLPAPGPPPRPRLVGKLSFIDLAGSERGAGGGSILFVLVVAVVALVAPTGGENFISSFCSLPPPSSLLSLCIHTRESK